MFTSVKKGEGIPDLDMKTKKPDTTQRPIIELPWARFGEFIFAKTNRQIDKVEYRSSCWSLKAL